jgi:endonuclease-3
MAPKASPGSRPRARATAARAVRILDILEETHPEARCALDYRNPFELSVATILSAQCTDERVNQVTPLLFERFPTARALAEADPAEVEPLIRSTGFFRAKARSIIGFARGLVHDHGGEIPRSVESMRKLPGVGRKTANVVLGHAYGINEGVAVDTHVLRVTNRLGLVRSDDPLKVEAQLMALVPRERWTRTTDLFIFHGRKICDARRPRCGECPLFPLCRFESRQTWAAGGAARTRTRGVPKARGGRKSR